MTFKKLCLSPHVAIGDKVGQCCNLVECFIGIFLVVVNGIFFPAHFHFVTIGCMMNLTLSIIANLTIDFQDLTSLSSLNLNLDGQMLLPLITPHVNSSLVMPVRITSDRWILTDPI